MMDKSNPLISFLIINYNNTNLLPRAIESCLKQTYKNFEILVFDDRSEISIANVIKKYKSNQKVKFYQNKKKKIMIPAFDAANAYEYLVKKSNGTILSLLDSDDYVHKNKAKEIINIFTKFKKISFVQNLIINKKQKKKQLSNSPLSYWPYLAPESCINFRKPFFFEYLKKTKSYKNKYRDLWLGFRLGIYSYYKTDKFFQLNKTLTYYENFGESLKYKRFNYNWWIRRKNSFIYTYKVSNNKKLILNFDFFITMLISLAIKLIK